MDKELFEIMINRFQAMQLEKEIPDNRPVPENVFNMFKDMPYVVLIRPLVLRDRARNPKVFSLQKLSAVYKVGIHKIRHILGNYANS